MPRIRPAAIVLLMTLIASSMVACATSTTPPPVTPTASTTQGDQPVAGDIPDNTVYITVTGDSGAFAVEVPQGWARSTVHGTTTYTDKLNSVSFAQTAAGTAPTVDSVKTGAVAQLKQTMPTFALTDVTTVSLPKGPAIRIRYTVDSAPNAVTGKIVPDAVEAYVLWKNGQQVLLTLSGPQTADNVDPWKKVSESFAWTK